VLGEVDFCRDRYTSIYSAHLIMRIFEVKDKSGRVIYLSDERWKHILEHREMQNKLVLEKIKDALINPNKIMPDRYDSSARVYYKHYKDRNEYLAVLVNYLNGEGFIITSFYTDQIK